MRSLLPWLFAFASPVLAGPIYVGTNTKGAGGSKGIYFIDFDPGTGTLGLPLLAAESGNPGFLAMHPEKPILYAAGLPKKPSGDGTGAVAAFRIVKEERLEYLGEVSSGGKNACHLAVDGTGGTIAVANYTDGSISTLRLDERGAPEKLVSVIRNEGGGPNRERQEGPHAHGVYFDRGNRHLLVPDLGLDRVFVYDFDADSSTITAKGALETAPGAGPRHLAFSPDARHVYVINELDQTVLTAAYGEGDGKLEALGSVTTLPEGFEGRNTTAEVEVHPNGRFVYASNRGHDSIAVYERDLRTGSLKFLQRAPCGGKTPRHFKIDPTGEWLVCAHQDSNTISVLWIDRENGLLAEPSSTVECPSPTCVLFAR